MSMTEDDLLVGYFLKHVVGVRYVFQKDEVVDEFIVTCFVLSVGQKWFLITAGHCIAAIKERSKLGFELMGRYLDDSYHLNPVNYDTIPLTTEGYQLGNEYDFDCGVFVLSQYYKELLEKNNIQPLSEEVWEKQPPQVDFYKLLGIPAQTSTLR